MPVAPVCLPPSTHSTTTYARLLPSPLLQLLNHWLGSYRQQQLDQNQIGESGSIQ